ncbi:MAG: O-antigen ligase family protein [Patescibacteria group bacterium]
MTIILIFVSLAWGLFAWKKPTNAVLWFPILLPTYVLRGNIGPFPTTLLELTLLAMLLGVTIAQGKTVWLSGLKKIKPWFVPVLFWVAVTVLSIFVAPNHIAALGLWRAYVLEPLLYFILLKATLRHEEDRRVLVRSLVIIMTIVAVWAIFQFVTNIGIPHPWDVEILKRRATGPFPFPNALSLFAAPIAALCFGTAAFVKKDAVSAKDLRLSWIGFAAGLIATLLAKSVGGTLAILTAVFVTLIWKKRTRFLTLIATGITVITILLIPTLRTPIIHNLSFQDWSGKVRLIIWNESWNMLKDRPIFGAGLGAYPEVIKPYHKATFIEIFQYPHNIILNLWSETGLLGILAFALIIITWFRLSLKPASSLTVHRSLFILPLIAILIQGLVDVPYFKNDLAILFWIFAALI